MAAVVSGSSLGLLNSSLSVLGSQGALGQASQGRAGEQVFVNADTGNLVIQNRDELLVGRGPDLSFLRTYNSQGLLNDDNGDNWRLGVYRKVYNLTGTVNTAGSTVTRVAEDGSESVYAFDTASGKYVCHDGGGSFDTLSFSSAAQTWTWSWTDGTNQITEVYDAANGGRITSVAGQAVRDQDGNGLTFTYNAAGLIIQVTDASGESTFLDYAGNDLTQLRTVNSTGQTLIRTRYGYDTSHRLTTVTTDLSPEDASIADGKTYVVTYTYDDTNGPSKRVATLTQSDGTRLTFAYVQVGTDFKVSSITDALGQVTSFTYGTAAPTTTVNANPAALTTPTVGWAGASLLETSATAASQPRVGFDAAGNGIAVWVQGADVLASRYTKSTGTWSAVAVLDENNNAISALQLYVDASGNAIASWVQSDGGAPSTYQNRYRFGAWLGTQTVESAAGSVAQPAGSINANGDSAMVWRQANATGGQDLYANRRPLGTGWTGAVLIETGAGAVGTPAVAIDAQGNITAIWQQNDGTVDSIYSSRYTAATGWSAPVLIESSAAAASSPRIGLDSAGNAVAVWVQGADLVSSTYNKITGAWSAASVLDSNANAVSAPTLYVDPSGNAIATWVQSDGVAASVYANRYVAGAWIGAQLLESATGVTNEPTASINAAGNAVVLWRQTNGTVEDLFASRFTGGAWTAPQSIEAGAANVATPAVAIDAQGNIQALWQQSDGAAASIYTNRYVPDATPYYTVQGTSWAAVAQAVYGTAAAAGALQAALGNPALTPGVRLAVPASLTYSIVTAPANNTGLSTTDTQTTTQTFNANTAALTPQTGNPNPLPNWVPVTNLSAAAGAWLVYQLEVPVGQTELFVSTSGGTGNANLYVRRGAAPTTTLFDASSTGTSNTESVRIANPAAGTWYVGVLASAAFSGMRLEGHYQSGTASNVVLQPGQVVSDLYGKTNNTRNFSFEIPAGTTNFRLTLSGSGAGEDADMYMTYNAPVNLGSPGFWSEGPTVDETITVDAPSAGTWNVVVKTFSSSLTDATLVLQTDLGSNTAPTVQGGAPQRAVPGALVTLAATASDAQGAVSYQWTQLRGPAVTLTNATAATASFTAPNAPGPTTLDFQVRVTDSNGATITDIVHVLVDAPVLGYVVPANPTWATVASAIYGSAAVATQLQTALGNPALTQNSVLKNLPATLSNSTTATVTVAPYYTVQSGNTWTTIAQAVYGTSDPGAAQALRDALGGPALVSGVKLTMPQSLTYSVPGSQSTGSGRTLDVTDPLMHKTSIFADAQGQITQILSPAGQSVSYTYDANGNVTGVTDARGLVTTYGYDFSGNRILERDAVGNTITRVYGSKNELLTETSYVVPDPDGAGAGQPGTPLTARYVYDSLAHLRFVISAEGRVTEYRYNTFGQRVAAIQYTSSLYNLTALTPTSTLTEAQLITFVGTADKTRTERVDSTYDPRGQVATATSYTKVDTGGNGVADGSQSVTRYVYDQAGNLVQTIDGRGSSTAYVYDGLGRLTKTTDAAGDPPTTTFYDDANRMVVLTSANGLKTISTYDAKGELISVIQSATPEGVLGTTSYFYDADGRLRRTVDPTGINTHVLYDAADRKIATIDGTGSLTEYRYDADNNLTRIIEYATALTPAQLASLIGTGGNPTAITLDTTPAGAGIRPGASAQDRITANAYDSANRLVKSVDELGFVTQYFYDGAGRLTDSVTFATPIGTAALGNTPSPASINPVSDPRDQLMRSFYDADGKLRGTLDAAGFLTEYKYDASGQLVETVAYATVTDPALRTSGTLAQLLLAPAAANNANDIHGYTLYDSKGQVVGTVDGEGYLTEYAYDAAGNKTQTARYATRVAFTPGASIASIRPRAALVLPGAIGSYASTPDTLANSVTGDLDLRAWIAPTDWTPAALQEIIDKSATDSSQFSYLLRLNPDGTLNLYWSSNGTTLSSATSTAQVGAADGTAKWVRATLGVSNRDIRFYTSDDGTTWIQLGAAVTLGGTTSIFDGSAPLRIGVRNDNVISPFAGRIYYAEVRSGINGTVVAKFNPAADAVSLGGTSFTSSTGETWTLAGAAALLGGGPQDQVSTYTYTALNQLSTATDALGTRTKYSYNNVGNLTQTVIAQNTGDARTLNAQYDKQGRLTADLSAANIATTYTYDADGRRTSITDRNGARTLFYYDADGHLTHTIDALGEVTESRYNALGQATQRIAYAGRLSGTTLTGLSGGLANSALTNALAAVANAVLDSTTTYTYTLRGQVASVTDPLNQSTTTYTYDADGDLVAKTEAVGKPEVRNTRYVYDANDRLVYTVDASGGVTKNEYDAEGRVTRTIAYTTALSNFSTLPATPVASDITSRLTLSPNDQILTHVYDRDEREVYTIDALGGVTQRVYDAAGNVIQRIGYAKTIPTSTAATVAAVGAALVSVSDAVHDNNVRLFYDVDNRLVFTIDGLGEVTRNDYDARDNVVRVTSYAAPLSAAQFAGLGPNSTVLSVQSLVVANAASDSVEQRVFDADDRLIYRIDALGFITENTYNAVGQVIRTTRYAQAIPSNTPATRDAVSNALAANGLAGAGLALPGVAGNFASTPDAPANSVTGDLDVRVFVAPTDWTPAVSQDLFTKWQSINVNQRSFIVRLNTSGGLTFIWSPDGVNFTTINSTVAVPAADGTPKWVRVTLKANNGTGGNDVTFSTSVDGVTWTQLGAPVTTPGATSIFDSTAPLLVGQKQTLSDEDPFQGKLYYAELRNGINGAVVAKFNSADATDPNVRSIVSLGTNETWTVSGGTLSAPDAKRIDIHVYDGTGRLVYNIDGQGEVTRNDYDARGNVIRTTQYATRINIFTLGVNPSVSSVQVLASQSDHVEQRVYDADDRPVYEIDALGFVTKSDYDALGQVIHTTRYAQAIPLNTPPTLTAVAAAVVASTIPPATRALNLSGAIGGYASTPDTAINSVTGDLDVRVQAAAADWTPATDFTHLIGKWDGAGGAGVSWFLAVRSTGALYLQWMEGGATRSALSTVATGLADGARKWVRATLDVDNGANGYSVRFFTSDDGVAWTQLGATVTTTGATTSIADSAGAVTVGTRDHGIAGLFAGKIYYADFRNGIDAAGTVVAKFNPADAGDSNARTFTSSSGETWTLSGSAVLDAPSLAQHQADFAYDAAGHLVYQVDGEGEVTRNDYDAAGDLTRTTDYATPISVAALGSAPTLASVQARVIAQPALDHVEQRVFDAAGRLLFDIDAAGFVTQYTYDGNANAIQRSRYANRLQGTFAPGVAPQVIAPTPQTPSGSYVFTDPLDQVTRTVYDVANRPVFLIDAAGFVTQRFYDAKGNLVKELQYANPVQVSSLAPGVAPQVVLSSSGDRSSRYVYDADGRMRYSIDPKGYVTERRYDGFGQELQHIAYADAVSVADGATVATVAALFPSVPASAVVTEIHYDNVGHILDTVDGKGVVTRSVYDAFGNAIAKIQALGLPEQRTTSSIYDALGRLTVQTTPSGTTSQFRFDAFGNEIAYVDPRGPLFTTLQMFDGVNRKLSSTDPLGGVTRTDYDAFGNVVRAIDPNGNAGFLYYDQRNLQVAQVDPEGDFTEYGYDAFGNKTQTIRYAVPVSVPYDPSRPLDQIRPKGATLPGVSGSYFSTPDAPANSVTGDIDMRVLLTHDSWAPVTSETFITKDDLATNRDYGFRFNSGSTGKLQFVGSPDGVTTFPDANGVTGGFSVVSTAATGFAPGSTHWVRVTRSATTGQIKFYTSDDYDSSANTGTWTQLGDTIAAPTGTIHDGTAILQVGSRIGAADNPLKGTIYYADVRNGIDALAPVAKFNPSADATAANVAAFSSSTGEVWTRSGFAAVTAGSPQDQITTTSYDTLGRVTKIVDAEGHAELFSYDRNTSNVSSHQDKNGNITTYDYDADGNKTAEHSPVPYAFPFLFRADDPLLQNQITQRLDTFKAASSLHPQIAADAQGNAIAVWIESGATGLSLHARRYAALTGIWGADQVLATTTQTLDSPQVAVDGQGNAIVSWLQFGAVHARRYDAASDSWQADQTLGTGSFDLQLTTDSQGNAIAVWRQPNQTFDNIVANRYVAATGTWQGAQVISTSTGTAAFPDVAFDAQGNAIAVWTQGGTNAGTFANRYRASTGTWLGAQLIGQGGSAQIALDAQGNAMAVWAQSDGTRLHIWATRYVAATGTWLAAQQVETDSRGDSTLARVALDSQGNATVVWQETWQEAGVTHANIFANRYSVLEGTWLGAQSLEANGAGPGSDPQIAIDDKGDIGVVWTQFDGVRNRIFANRYDTDLRIWQGPTLLGFAAAGSDGFEPKVTLSARGDAYAIWNQSGIFASHFVGGPNPFSIVNRYEYDAFGNMTKETLAQGLPGERVTRYVYDKNGKPVEMIEPQVLTQQAGVPFVNGPGAVQATAGGAASYAFAQTSLTPNSSPSTRTVQASITVTWPPIIGYGDGTVKVVWKTDTSTTAQVTATTTSATATSLTLSTASQNVAAFNEASALLNSNQIYEVAIYKQTVNGDVLISRTTGNYVWGPFTTSTVSVPGDPSKSGSLKTQRVSAGSSVSSILSFSGASGGKGMHVVYWPSSDPNNLLEVDLKYYGSGVFSGLTPTPLDPAAGTYSYEARAYGDDGALLNVVSGTFLATSGAVTATIQAQPVPTGVLQTPHVFKAYDAVGNLVQETDAKGNVTRSYYDANSRLIGTVNADRVLRRYFYDAAGNLIIQRTYGDRIPDAVGLATLPDPASIAGMNPANFREADYRYSANGQQVETDTQPVLVYDRINGQRLPQPLVTTRQYDRNGNVILDTDANGNKTYTYYDRADRKVAQVDASRYLTTWAYDAEGNVLRKTSYATAIAPEVTLSTGSDPAALAALVAAGANRAQDRICLYAYDRMNRMVQETTLGVLVTNVDAANGTPLEQLTDVVERKRYDNAGNLIATIQDTAETDYFYDRADRLIEVLAPSITDLNGATVRNIRNFIYDSAGNLVYLGQNGSYTFFQNDPHGNRTLEVDPLGNRTSYYYDLNGNLTVKHTTETSADGTFRGVDVLYEYDKLDRQVKTTAARNFTNYVRYDAFDEIIEKGLNNLAQEYEQYDNAGRLIKTNKDDGVDRAYLYDANGNVTAKIQSGVQDVDIRSMAIDLIAALPALAVQRTESSYDAKNQVTGVFQAPIAPGPNDTGLQEVWVDAMNDPFSGGTMTPVKGGGTTYDFSVQWDVGGQQFQGIPSLNVSWASITGFGDGDIQVVWESNGVQVGSGVVTYDKTSIQITPSWFGFSQSQTTYAVSIYKKTFAGLVLVSRSSGNYAWTRSNFFGVYHATGQIPDELLFTGQRPDAQSMQLWLWPAGGDRNAAVPVTLSPLTAVVATNPPVVAVSVPGQFAFDWSSKVPGQYSYEYQTIDSSGNVLEYVKGVVGLARDSTWQGAQLIETDNRGFAGSSDIAFDAQGNAIAVWHQSDGTRTNIYANRYIAATGTWQTPQLVETDDRGSASLPQIAFDSQGNAIAVWTQSDGTRNNIYTSRYVAATQTWQSAQLLETDDRGSTQGPQIAMDAQGNAIAVWVQWDGARNNVVVNRFASATGTWQGAQLIETGAGSAQSPQIAFDAQGNALAVWSQFDGVRFSIYANRYAATTGTWAGAQTIEANEFDATIPQIAFDAQGNATAVWQMFDGAFRSIYAARYVATLGGWQAEQQIDPTIGGFEGVEDAFPQIALDAQGNAIAVWSAGDGSGVRNNIYANRYSAATGAWEGTRILDSSAFGSGFRPQIAFDTKGNATAVWFRADAVRSDLYANRFVAAAGTWQGAQLIGSGAAPSKIAFDAQGNAITVLDANGNIQAIRFVTLGVSSKLARTWQNPTSGLSNAALISVGRTQTFNAFGQVFEEADALGSKTTLTYNHRGDLIEKDDPRVKATDRNGALVSAFQPTTRYYYDYLGRAVGTQDAALNQNTRRYDAAGNLLVEYEPRTALGTTPTKRYAYDAAGNLRSTTNELGLVDTYTYDAKNQLIRVDHPTDPAFVDATHPNGNALRFDTYAYDEEGRRTRHTNALGSSDLTFYDDTGRVTRTTDAAGVTIQYRYLFDPASKGTKSITVQQTAAGTRTLQDTKNYFGRLLTHVDLGGHQFFYTYNKAGWLIQQTAVTNPTLVFNSAGIAVGLLLKLNPVGGSNQNISYSYYQNGLLKQAYDAALNTRAGYQYDRNGNLTFEGYTQTTALGPIYYQEARVSYDALNRVTGVADLSYNISYEYDRNGNRRHIFANYRNGLTGAPQVQDYWYDYDSMNRFTVTQGTLLDSQGQPITVQDSANRPLGNINIGTTGTSIGYYDDGQRKTATYKSGTRTFQDIYTYADGLLTKTDIIDFDLALAKTRPAPAPGDPHLGAATRTYDAAGEVKTYVESGVAGGRSSTYTYAADGKVSQEVSNTTGTSRYIYDDSGTPLKILNPQGNGTTLTTLFSYEYWDTAKQSAIQVQPSNAAAPGWQPGFSSFTYDVNGHLTQVDDVAGNRTLRYALDARGLVLQRNEINAGQTNKTQRYYYLNGIGIGDSGTDPSRTDYAAVLISRGQDPQQLKTAKPVSSADFGSDFMPINDRYPAGTPGSYTIQGGEIGSTYDETLRSVALAVWGDSSLWYVIADANGLTAASAPLVAGQTLVIPNVVANVHNNVGTFKPYDAGRAIGDTSPTLPDPPPPPEDDCGSIGLIIVVVVAIVVMVYTAGAASEVLPELFAEIGAESTTVTGLEIAGDVAAEAVADTGLEVAGSSVWESGLTALSGQGGWAGFAGAVIGGAAGSAAGQLTAMGLDMQKHFSWKQVGMAAVGAGVTAGIGAYAGQAGGLANELKIAGYLGRDASLAFNAMVANLVTQGIGRATHWQETFSWRSAAISAVSAVASSRLTDFIQGDVARDPRGNVITDSLGNPVRTGTDYSRWVGDFGAKLTTSLVSGVATAAVRRRVYNGGKVDYGQIAGDAFGNTLGNSITEDLARNGVQGPARFDTSADLDAAYGTKYQPQQLGPQGAEGEFSTFTNNGVSYQSAMPTRSLAPGDQTAGSNGLGGGLLKVDWIGQPIPQDEATKFFDSTTEKLGNWSRGNGFVTDEQAKQRDDYYKTGIELFGNRFIADLVRTGELPLGGPLDLVTGLVGGSGAARIDKEALDATTRTEKALAFGAREPGPLRELEVGTYKELKAARNSFGSEGVLELDHIPSQAALRIAAEDAQGGSLTARQMRELEDNTVVLAMKKELHEESRTYAGSNNALKVLDSSDLHAAIKADLNVFAQNALNAGISESRIMRAMAEVVLRNRQAGIIR